MKYSASDFIFILFGTVLAVLAVLSAEFPAVVTGYIALVLGLLVSVVMAVNEGRSYAHVSHGAKLFLALGAVGWLVASILSAVLAVVL